MNSNNKLIDENTTQELSFDVLKDLEEISYVETPMIEKTNLNDSYEDDGMLVMDSTLICLCVVTLLSNSAYALIAPFFPFVL